MIALQPLAVDEEGRCGIDLKLVMGYLARLHDLAEQLLVGEALVELVLGDAGLPRDLQELILGVDSGNSPVLLRREHGVDHGIIAVVAGAAGEHEGGGGEVVERELAQHVAGLARVDIFGFELREDLSLELRAVRTGHGGVLHDGVGRVGRADDDVGKGTGRQEHGHIRIDLVFVRDLSAALVKASAPVIDARRDRERHEDADRDHQGLVWGGFFGLAHWLSSTRFGSISGISGLRPYCRRLD
jgi:hypothetical protein